MIIYLDNEEYEFGRLDTFLADYFEDISRSKIKGLIDLKQVLVNDKYEKAGYKVKFGDKIEIDLSGLTIKELEKENLPIDVIYEDADIAIVNKPRGILSHPTDKIREKTLVNFLLYRFKNLSELGGQDRPGIVHRLDMNTSGLMLIALSDRAYIKLKDMFKNHEINKYYRAIINGKLSKKDGILEYPIGRNPHNRKLMTVIDSGRYAKTSYHVETENSDYSYLDIKLYTGRTHQIRVHFSHIGHPILGDKDYKGTRSKYKLDNQLLQAYRLNFIHPITHEEMDIRIDEDPLIKKYKEIIFSKEDSCILR